VLTSGGLLGKVVRVSEDYLAVDVGTGLEVKIQKAAIAAVLPKGTLAKI
jgi:preprotein translocase subunit YajC